MTNLANRCLPEPLRSLGESSISSSYAAIGTALANPSRIFYLQNLTDVSITFSWDGTHDHVILPSNGFLLIDVTSDRTDTGGAFAFSAGTIIYAKGSPSMGSVYLSTFYGANG